MDQSFPSLTELLTNPIAAAAIVTLIVNAVSYATGFKPNWLAVVVALVYMVTGYIVTGKTTPEELFLAVIYAFIMIPLAHLDGATLAKLFGKKSAGTRVSQEPERKFFQDWLS